MGFVIFVGAVLAVVGGVLGVSIWLTRARPGATQYVLLAAAAGENEAKLWSDRLSSAGITARVRDVGDFRMLGGGVSPYAYEVWVRAKDEARARKALGL
jgi:hypothetical protein